MITDENLEKLYDSYVNNVELTTKELNSYGFNSADLTTLIKKGSIERIQRGLYNFKSESNLYLYAKTLIHNKEYKKAEIYLKKLHEIKPNDTGVALSLFLNYISNNDYDKALIIYDDLSKFIYGKYKNDMNYYLYLLNIIIDLPDKYKKASKSFTINDIKVLYQDDKRYQDINYSNRIRALVFNGKIAYAKSLSNSVTSENMYTSIEQQLLIRAGFAWYDNKNAIIDLINNNKYQEVVDYVLDLESRYNIAQAYKNILKLASSIIKIKQSGIVPEKGEMEKDNIIQAIETNNFEYALKLTTEFNEKYNIENKTDGNYLLLSHICSLIDSLSKKNTQKENKIEIQNVKISAKTSAIEPSLPLIISYLTNQDIDNALKCLNKYMISINKSEYEFLLVDLIKLSLLDQDMAFVKPMTVLSIIENENFSFDLSSYIKNFYISLSENKLKQARVYLDIISKSSSIGYDCILTDGMYKILEAAEKNIKSIYGDTLPQKEINIDFEPTDKNNSNIEEEIEDNCDDNEEYLEESQVYDDAYDETNIEEEQIVEIIDENANKKYIPNIIKEYESKIKEIPESKIDSEKRNIEKIHGYLAKNRGIVILKPMDTISTERIQKLIDSYPDMTYFAIKDGQIERLVIKYIQINKENIDIDSLKNLAIEQFKNKQYSKSIDSNLELISINDTLSLAAYTSLGIAHLKIKKIHKAIGYLTIATFLSKVEGKDIDFTELIMGLKGLIPKEDIKNTQNIKNEDFNFDDNEEYYGIEEFDQINAYIVESGLDVTSACQSMNASQNTINIINLIYAKEYFKQGDIEQGNLFLKEVAKQKNKSEIVIKILNEITKRKNFYQNNNENNEPKILQLIKPNKK